MTKNKKTLSPNQLAFIALTNEYCQMLESVEDFDRHTFVDRITNLLSRIYITASDLDMNVMADVCIEPALDESDYDLIRNRIANLMAEEDVYLEVFLEDMKYSDTPISSTVSENLADLYQEFFNLLHCVEYATTEDQDDLLGLCYENFTDYWGQTLVNVLRSLHHIRYTAV